MRRNCWMLSALLLLLCLTACGRPAEDGQGPVETLGGKVYVPEFAGVELEADYVQGACISAGKVWLSGAVSQEAEMQDGAGNTFSTPITGPALFQGESTGGTFRQMEGYRSFDFLNGAAGYASSPKCWPGREGTVWIATSVIPWDGQPPAEYIQQFDANGTELTRIDLHALPGNLSLDGIFGFITDSEDRLYLYTEDNVTVFDQDQRLLFTLDVPDGLQWDALVLLEDGRAAVRTAGSAFGEAGSLRAVRPENNGWGESYPLPVRCDEVWSGGGGYLFFCSSGDALYGYNVESGELERLLSWTGVNINSGRILCLSAQEDGQLTVVTGTTGSGAEVTVLTLADPASLPEVTVLTYATLDLRSEVRANIVEFNKSHTDCRIEVRDYSEYSGDHSAGLTKLHTEMLAGNIPDLLDTSGLPVREYGRKGYLEDLLPFIDSDPDLGREALMERVLDAACQDGKLYQAFPSFTILTAAGRPDLVGKRMNWTWTDFQTALAALPEGSTAFGGTTRDELLQLLLPMTLDGLVDREAGTVNEDAVRSLLEFCGTVPIQAEETGDIYAGTLEGRQLLLPAELGTLDWEAVLYPTAFGGACSYVGYPQEDGGAGSSFCLQDGAAMTSACKDKEAAWEFIRELFLPRYPTGSYFGTALPVNRVDFERMAAQSTEPLLDETGRPVEGSGWVVMPDSSLQVPIRPLTQEEYNQFAALYDAIDQVYHADLDLGTIIWEEAGAYFAGGKSLEDAVRLIANRAGLYLSENK